MSLRVCTCACMRRRAAQPPFMLFQRAVRCLAWRLASRRRSAVCHGTAGAKATAAPCLLPPALTSLRVAALPPPPPLQVLMPPVPNPTVDRMLRRAADRIGGRVSTHTHTPCCCPWSLPPPHPVLAALERGPGPVLDSTASAALPCLVQLQGSCMHARKRRPSCKLDHAHVPNNTARCCSPTSPPRLHAALLPLPHLCNRPSPPLARPLLPSAHSRTCGRPTAPRS